MPKLHIDEYTRTLSGKTVAIACREGILRDHFADIIADIKFLNRCGLVTTLFHNMSNRFANRQHFRTLEDRLAGTRIIRVPPEFDFYDQVLKEPNRVLKLVFLERKPLIDLQGHQINALTTRVARQTFADAGHLIANTNFRGILDRICQFIEEATMIGSTSCRPAKTASSTNCSP